LLLPGHARRRAAQQLRPLQPRPPPPPHPTDPSARSTRWDACAASGYPVTAAGQRVVSLSGLPARRAELNEWIVALGCDPVTGAAAAPFL